MKLKSKILFPIIGLVGLVPCITSCYTEPSYKVIGSAKITNFQVNYDPSAVTRSLITDHTKTNNDILHASSYHEERLTAAPPVYPDTFDDYLNYSIKVNISIQFDTSGLDSTTQEWLVENDPFEHANLNLARFHLSTLTYQEMDTKNAQLPQAGQKTLLSIYSNYAETNIPGDFELTVHSHPDSNAITWEVKITTCLGQIYGLKLDSSADGTKYIHTEPYTSLEKFKNIQNQLRLKDASNSYISAPNGNRFDFDVDSGVSNLFFTFVKAII